jgi:PiT family inorganic phosphate transporter
MWPRPAQRYHPPASGLICCWPGLLIALGFEFVNGFHDTANAVATVIYTNSLDPNVAVVWSGLCNLAGVLASSGTVAFAVITLLPVELILQVSSGAGFAMVFACSSPPSCGTWAPGGWACPLPARTPWSAPSSASASPTSC